MVFLTKLNLLFFFFFSHSQGLKALEKKKKKKKFNRLGHGLGPSDWALKGHGMAGQPARATMGPKKAHLVNGQVQETGGR